MTTMDEFEMEEKLKILEDMAEKRQVVKLENTLLSQHLARVMTRKGSLQLQLEALEEDAQAMEVEGDAKASSTKSPKPSQSAEGRGKGTVRFTTPTPISKEKKESRVPSQSLLPMSTEEKLEIAEEEHNVILDQIEKLHAENEHVLDDLRAVYKEAIHCIGETRKERCDFNRDVVWMAQVNPSKRPYSEDVLRFLEERLRRKHGTKEKLLKKIDALREQIIETEHQFSTKTNLKDLLHAVDFDQVAIQNQQVASRIQDRSNELLHLKADFKTASQTLEHVQMLLNKASTEGIQYKQSLEDRSPLIVSNKEQIFLEKQQKMPSKSKDEVRTILGLAVQESQTVAAWQRKLRETLLLLLQDEEGPPQPRALDYMHLLDRVGHLRKELRNWQNKVEIVELTAKQLERNLHSSQRTRSQKSTSRCS